MRDCSAATAALLANPPPGLRSADLFTFTLQDGVTVYRWTSYDRDLTVNGDLYSSRKPWLERSRWSLSNTMEVPTLEVYLRALNDGFAGGQDIKAQITNGLFDGGSGRLDRIFFTDIVPSGTGGTVILTPTSGGLVVDTTFTEDFSSGLANFSVYQGSSADFTIVTDTFGNALQVAPGPNAIDAIVEPIGNNIFSEVHVKFKVTASAADDLGVMDLRAADGTLVLNFTPGRQASIDSLRRPNITFHDQNGQPGNPIGVGAVTLNHWYQLDALYDGSANFTVTITDLTSSTTFGTITVPVSARSPIAKLIFRTENSAGSGTVRWDDFSVDLLSSAAEPLLLFGGNVANIDLTGNQATINIKGKTNLLDQYAPRNLYQLGCEHAFCDAGCTLSRAAFTTSYTVGASPTRTFIPWSGSAPANASNYRFGTVKFTSGVCAGQSRTVRLGDSTGLTLIHPLNGTPAAGDAFTAFEGCDKFLDSGSGQDCTARSNTQNWRAFPYVPPADTAF